MPHTNPLGLQLIESFEERVLFAYDDQGGYPPVPFVPTPEHPQPRGTLSIGYGHTAGVHVGQTCTAQEATTWLMGDLQTAERAVADAIEVDLTPNQFSALVSLEFNTGAPADATVFQLCNQRNFPAAADAFLAWNKVDGVVNAGLVRRRAAERELFLTP